MPVNSYQWIFIKDTIDALNHSTQDEEPHALMDRLGEKLSQQRVITPDRVSKTNKISYVNVSLL